MSSDIRVWVDGELVDPMARSISAVDHGVTVGDGAETKTYVLGDERTPAVRLQLSDAASDTSSDEGFSGFCLKSARDFFELMDVGWQTSWVR